VVKASTRRHPLVGVLLLGAAAAGCYDFGAVYEAYCATGRCSDAGPGPTDAGPSDAGSVDAGTRDAGSADAGPVDAGRGDAGPVVDAGPPCQTWGEACQRTQDCCNPGGAARDGGHDGGYLGCSGLNVCEFSLAGCLPDGYFCVSNADCCNGSCDPDAGTCHHCLHYQPGTQTCTRATDCCFQQDSFCDSTGICQDSTNAISASGAHCTSSDFCNGGEFCDFDAGAGDGGPADGICTNTNGACVDLISQYVDGGPPCCSGSNYACLATGQSCTASSLNLCCVGGCDITGKCAPTGPGGGYCCLPLGTSCGTSTACCSGACQNGVCATAAVPQPLHGPCVTGSDCASPATCDLVTGTCEVQYCFVGILGGAYAPVCGTLSGSVFNYLDGGGFCLAGAAICTSSSQCCSLTCILIPPFGTGICTTPPFYVP